MENWHHAQVVLPFLQVHEVDGLQARQDSSSQPPVQVFAEVQGRRVGQILLDSAHDPVERFIFGLLFADVVPLKENVFSGSQPSFHQSSWQSVSRFCGANVSVLLLSCEKGLLEKRRHSSVAACVVSSTGQPNTFSFSTNSTKTRETTAMQTWRLSSLVLSMLPGTYLARYSSRSLGFVDLMTIDSD